jgi:hypothetical protein
LYWAWREKVVLENVPWPNENVWTPFSHEQVRKYLTN